ncbi:hypothetical protein I317_07442 [Kwoniella heveanensis CBS 569]|nr:hypothetical protein I317_07442 [Kwoniella heveanensis CBS 569]
MSEKKNPDYSDNQDHNPDEDLESRSDSNSRSPNRRSDYFNYHPPLLLVILEFLVWIFLLLVCFASPNGGLAAVVKGDDGNYVGVLRKCSKTSCDGWMAASATGGGSDTTSKAKRDVSSIDLASFYLRAGLASLSCFWLMTYTLIFLLTRYISSSPPPPSASSSPKNGRWGLRDMFKRFSWRISRIFTFFLVFIVFGVACDATWQVKVAGVGAAGIGLGVILLHASWLLLILCTYLEISRGHIRAKAELTYWGCGFLQFCPSYKQRAIDKWDGVSSAEQGAGLANGEDDEDGRSGSGHRSKRKQRGRSRSRTRERSRKDRKRKEDKFEDVDLRA